MEPKLHVIKGGEHFGKTTTCWKLLNKLNPIVECYHYWITSSSDLVVHNKVNNYYALPQKGVLTPVDFVVVARLNNPSHCKVAIISAGDEDWFLKEQIYQMLTKGAQHIVCCERTKDNPKSTYRLIHREFPSSSIFSETEILIPRNDVEEDRVADIIYNELSKL